jgi:N-methylhydantoinase A
VPIGVDVGGTFTDVVYVDEATGRLVVHKLPSTPTADSTVAGIRRVLELGGGEPAGVSFVGHGSTIATNAVIERRGARVALVTTRGFRDVLEMGRLSRPPGHLYDLFFTTLSAPLVRRAHRFEVTERVDHTGRVVTPLAEDEVRAVARQLRDEGITSVAVCYLFAFVHPAHEQRTRAILAEELGPLDITLSSDVLPEFREYERTATTVLHAYVKPLISGYLGTLAQRLSAEAGLRAPLFLMQSNGGLSSPAVTIERPATLLLSGPSGGVVASCHLAEQLGFPDMITVDMGGTSFDVALVRNGRPEITDERRVLHQPVRVAMVDIHSIGAGGGSIAWLDEAGGLHVGPHSAGSSPGPACYGQGGTEVTVTDANLLLGYLDPASFLGGAMRIEPELAAKACHRLAEQLDLDVLRLAAGIRRLINVAMAGAIRAMTVKKGRDPRELPLLAFGGAGPLHAADLMLELDIPWVVVPEYPGCFSAQGIILTDVRHDYVQSLVVDARAVDPAAVGRALDAMAARGQADLAADEVPPANRRLERSLDLRYRGQAYGLSTPLPDGPVDQRAMAAAIDEFQRRHERLYGFNDPEAAVELVNAKLLAIGRLPQRPDQRRPAAPPPPAPAARVRRVHFPPAGEVETRVYARADLVPGHRVAGPAIVEQLDTTTVVPPGLWATVHPTGALILGREPWEPR